MKLKKYAVIMAASLVMAAAVPFAAAASEDPGSSIGEVTTNPPEELVSEAGIINENVRWTLDTKGTMIITGSGDMSLIEHPIYNQSSKVKKVIFVSTSADKPLTGIGESLFHNFTQLTEVTIPDTVKQIGNNAFYNCIALESVSIPNCKLGEKTFMGCSALKKVTFKNGVETIPGECFRDCTALESITLPDSVKTIAHTNYDNTGAFFNCKALKKVSIGKNIESISQYAFRTRGSDLEVTFREGVTAIPDDAFKSRDEITKLVLPSTLETIGSSAFSNCKNLSKCSFPDSLTSIGTEAFYGCAFTELSLPGCEFGIKAFSGNTALKTVKIADGTKTIPGECFRDCTALEDAFLPDTVKTIERTNYDNTGAFFNCPALKKVSIGQGIESIDQYTFRTRGEGLEVTFREGTKVIPENSFIGREEITKLNLPSTLKTIGSEAFYKCSNLSVCSFPSSITSIGSEAFYGCALTELSLPGCELGIRAFESNTALKTVKIGEGTKVIPGECFRDCTSLESAYLPDSVKSIERTNYDNTGAFFNCPAMKKVSIGKGIEKIDQYAFRTKGKSLEVTFREGTTAIPAESFSSRDEVTKLVLPSTLESIGSNAFSRCTNLSVCSFPSSITSIGSEAFIGCALTELSLPGCELGIRAFMENTALKNVTIGEGAKVIPGECFRGCTSLESAYLPDSVQNIDRTNYDNTGAFFECKALKTISIGKGIQTIDQFALRTKGESLEVTFREGLTSLPKSTITFTPSISFVLPETVEAIEADTIVNCSTLKTISIGAADCDIEDSAKTIPSSALIKGYEDSTAHQYAEKYERAFKSFEEEDPTIMYGSYITSVSLTLDGSIGVNFFAKLSKNAVKVVISGPDGKTEYSGDKLAAALQKDGKYKFSCGINATQAGKPVTMRIYGADGKKLDIYNSNFEKFSNMEFSYSVNKYIAEVSNYADSPKLNNMINALDTYCKAAENFFCNGTYDLDIPKADVVKTNSFNKKFKISLVLDSRTALRIYSDAESAAQVTASGDHKLTAVKAGKNSQYFEISDIYAQDLTEDLTVKLDGVTYKICPMDYCALVLADKNSSKKLTDVCSAIYYYGVAAKEYKNN